LTVVSTGSLLAFAVAAFALIVVPLQLLGRRD
jgi:hypothetical protein